MSLYQVIKYCNKRDHERYPYTIYPDWMYSEKDEDFIEDVKRWYFPLYMYWIDIQGGNC